MYKYNQQHDLYNKILKNKHTCTKFRAIFNYGTIDMLNADVNYSIIIK